MQVVMVSSKKLYFSVKSILYAGVVQLARMSPFQGEGCRFEPDHPLQFFVFYEKYLLFFS